MKLNLNIRHIRVNRLIALAFALMMPFCFISAQKTYLVAVGLNNYDDGENPLPCSIGDARAICSFFNQYGNCDVFMLKDSNATRDHILRVLKQQFSKAGPADEIIFAYSGHGFDGGLTCYDTKNVLYCSEIQEILRKSPAKRKVMLINSCHSGSFSKKYGYTPRGNYKSNNSNVMLFLSSRASESSWERTDMYNSYFFTRLLQALKGAADRNNDRKVTARELFNYVYEGVIYDTGGRQHPQMYGRFADDMVVVNVK